MKKPLGFVFLFFFVLVAIDWMASFASRVNDGSLLTSQIAGVRQPVFTDIHSKDFGGLRMNAQRHGLPSEPTTVIK